MFAYVILHYLSKELTIDCVNHILSLSNNSRIVIVDNCSPNKSGEELKSFYKLQNRVHVIISNTNLGFAKGNNLGYKYAKIHYSPDFIVVSNNDVIICDLNFENIVSKYFIENKVDIAGPDILTPDGFHQNPLSLRSFTTAYLRRMIIMNKIKILLFRIHIIYSLYVRYRNSNTVIIGNRNKPKSGIVNCILHGSFIIYAQSYIKKEDIAFIPNTFMYNEEFLLFDYIKEKGYSTGICNNATILHLGGKSTSLKCGNYEKMKFRFKYTTESLEVQYKLRKKYKDEK